METFTDLLKNLPHWEFEIVVSIVFALFEGVIVWPIINKWKKHHIDDHKDLEDLNKRIKKLESNGTGNKQARR